MSIEWLGRVLTSLWMLRSISLGAFSAASFALKLSTDAACSVNCDARCSSAAAAAAAAQLVARRSVQLTCTCVRQCGTLATEVETL